MESCKKIIKKHLEANGFDGLVHLDTECGCHLGDEGLALCGHFEMDCQPAYKHNEEGGWVMKLDRLINAVDPPPQGRPA